MVKYHERLSSWSVKMLLIRACLSFVDMTKIQTLLTPRQIQQNRQTSQRVHAMPGWDPRALRPKCFLCGCSAAVTHFRRVCGSMPEFHPPCRVQGFFRPVTEMPPPPLSVARKGFVTHKRHTQLQTQAGMIVEKIERGTPFTSTCGAGLVSVCSSCNVTA